MPFARPSAAPWPPAPFQYPQYQYTPLPPPPPRLRIPKRYVLGAALTMTVGIAVAVTSVATTQGHAGKPVPPTVTALQDEAARAVWRNAPVDTVLPPSVASRGGENYLRLGIAEAASCDTLPAEFTAELASDAPGTNCVKVLRATYTDATQTVLTTVGVVVIGGTPAARDKVWRQWTPDSDAKRPGMMPSVYPVPGTVAAKLDDSQRVVWGSQTSADGSFLVYAVAAFADGRAGSTPDQIQHASGRALAADSPPVQAIVDLPDAFVKLLKTAGATP
jgi:hypothetical protein